MTYVIGHLLLPRYASKWEDFKRPRGLQKLGEKLGGADEV